MPQDAFNPSITALLTGLADLNQCDLIDFLSKKSSDINHTYSHVFQFITLQKCKVSYI